MNLGRREGADEAASTPSALALPPIATWQLRLFARYCGYYLRRHFHRLYLLELSPIRTLSDAPLLICLNHPSWWDPIIGIFLSQHLFAKRRHYGPMAAAGISKYKFFERLGLFPIAPATREGAFRFLQIGRAALSTPRCTLWVTPQGQFEDVRVRPIRFQTGVGHLARSCSSFVVLPLALEYSFWRERTPEAFACFGEPIEVADGQSKSALDWTHTFALAVENTQNALAERVKTRQDSHFQELLSGSAGVGGVYDMWRAAKSYARGKRFRAEHGIGSR
jgi:1-acyl-sn-glycerol-3-phosphate acyltransferase